MLSGLLAFALLAGLLLWGALLWMEPLPGTGVSVAMPGARTPAGMRLPVGRSHAETPPPDLPSLMDEQPGPLMSPTTGEVAAMQPTRPVIAVRVEDDLGAPIAGAELKLRSRSQGRHGWSVPITTSATSDAHGLARWIAYPGQPFSVGVWTAPDGYVQDRQASLALMTATSSAGLIPVGADELPVFVIPRRSRVLVPLPELPQLLALERLVLQTTSGNLRLGDEPPWRTGKRPSWTHHSFDVDPGTCVLVAYWSADSGLYSPDQRFEVLPGEEQVVSLQVLRGTGVIRGRVVDPAGQPVRGLPLQVDILRAPDALPGSGAFEHSSVRRVSSDPDGRWRLEGLPPGRAYVLPLVQESHERYLAARSSVAVQPEIAVGARSQPPLEVEVVMEPGYRVVGRIAGPWRADWLAGRLDLTVQHEAYRFGDRSQIHRPRLVGNGNFLIEHCRSGTLVVRIVGRRPGVGDTELSGPGPTIPDALADESWRGVSGKFEVDPSLPEGTEVRPMLILE